MLAYIPYVALISILVDAIRVKQKVNAANTGQAQAANTVVGQAQAGQMLRDRYQLQKFLERRSKGQATPGKSFPHIAGNRRQLNGSATHLGTGSFGDVWQAHDTLLGKTVALKIFYQGTNYMTWRNADARGRQELSESASECSLIQQILKETHRKLYPIGASRICECYDEYISGSKYTDNTVFLVQEMCGASLDTAIIKSRKASRRLNYIKARQATKQMLQAVAFLQMFEPPLIHHDLKPGNVCINDKGQIKVIDWGGTVFGKRAAMFESAVATPLFTPPEASSGRQAFASPFWSYDAYALGLMHMMFVCPFVEDLDWYYRKPITSSLIQQVVSAKCPGSIIGYQGNDTFSQDLELIAALANQYPGSRPNPMKLLDCGALVNVEVPKLTEDQAEELLKFKVGDLIEYWSETYGEWMPGKVSAVDQRNGVYNLQQLDRTVLKNGADPGRVRKQQQVEDLRATVPEEFKVKVGNLREGNGILGSGVQDFVGHWEGDEVVGAQVRRALIGGDYAYSININIEQPNVRRTSRNTLEVHTYVSCNYGAHCAFEKVAMSCRKGFGQDKQEVEYSLTLTVQDYGSGLLALVDIPGREVLRGANCEIKAIADVSNASNNGKFQSYKRYLTLQEGREANRYAYA